MDKIENYRTLIKKILTEYDRLIFNRFFRNNRHNPQIRLKTRFLRSKRVQD